MEGRTWTADAAVIQNAKQRRSRWWDVVIQIVLGLLAAVFLVLFIRYAWQNADARSCPLKYDPDGAITEAHMREWAEDASAGTWPLTVPKWDNDKRACTCDADPDPTLQTGTRKTPVWIAPIDIAGLYPSAHFPIGFPRTAQAPKDHVKVCLERTKLAELWQGQDAQGILLGSGVRHCHDPGPPLRIYTGRDGDLFCSAAPRPGGHANGVS